MEGQKDYRFGHNVCAAKGCGNKSYLTRHSFFRFPKDPKRARTWVIACNREDLLGKLDQLHASHRLCQIHFEEKFYGPSKKKLTKTAVPTIFPSLEGPSSKASQDIPFFSNEENLNKEISNSEENTSVPKRKITLLQHVVIKPGMVMPTQPELKISIPDLPGTPQHTQISLSPTILDCSSLASMPTTPTTPTTMCLTSPTGTQTSQKLSASTPRKKKYRNTVANLTDRNNALQLENNELRQKLQSYKVSFEEYKALTHKFCKSKELADFINLQVCQTMYSPKGRRYSREFKSLSLSMYFTGPKLYKNKLMNLFCLPSPQTLLKHIRGINIEPGMNNDEIFNILKMKVDNFNEESRQCVLCFDEISIKANLFYNSSKDLVIGFEEIIEGKKNFKPAMHVLVLMVRGIYKKWKHPLCYFFTHSTCPGVELKNIICRAIIKLGEIGINVRATISDMGSNNVSFTKMLGIIPENPLFFIQDKKIIHLFDPPHIFKGIRNILLKYDLLLDGKLISWKHVVTFYNEDKKASIRAAPKISDSHVFPNNFEKMKVKYATQLISATVSYGMKMFIRFKVLPDEALATAEFFEMGDKLFDLFNSSHTSATKEYNRAFKGLDYQISFLKECYATFERLEVISRDKKNVTKKIKCFNSLRISINALLCLWKELQPMGIKFLFTRRLNQDCLENFFGLIRQQNGNCRNPSAVQFQRSFRKLVCLNLFHSGTENCEGDADKMLLKLADFQSSSTVLDDSEQKHDSLCIFEKDYQSDHNLERNMTRYISGYLIAKANNIHICDVCEAFAKEYNRLDDTSIFCHFKAYRNKENNTFGNLMMPSNTFVDYVANLDEIFNDKFEELATKSGIIQTLEKTGSCINFNHPCPNFPLIYVTKLFFRIKLFYTIKYINRNFKNINKNKLIIWRHL